MKPNNVAVCWLRKADRRLRRIISKSSVCIATKLMNRSNVDIDERTCLNTFGVKCVEIMCKILDVGLYNI